MGKERLPAGGGSTADARAAAGAPEPGLLEVSADEVALTLAQLVEMPGHGLFADGLGGPVEGLELIQLRLPLGWERPPGAAATGTGTIGSPAPRPHPRHRVPVLGRGVASRPGAQNDPPPDRPLVLTGGVKGGGQADVAGGGGQQGRAGPAGVRGGGVPLRGVFFKA